MSKTAAANDLTVIKIGGSVLNGPPAFASAAAFLARRLRREPGVRIVAVVSAQHGMTDSLLESARELVPDPDSEALDLLWSTGELRSVALLVFALHARGVRATAANVHQTGLTRAGCSEPVEFRRLRLLALLPSADVVVAPGFLVRTAGDRVRTLGRGGSDLSAVLLAAGLGAPRCELLKDVDGYFRTDPRTDSGSEHLDALGYEQAIAMAAGGCRLLQRDAIEAARDRRVTLVVRSLSGTRSTVVQ